MSLGPTQLNIKAQPTTIIFTDVKLKIFGTTMTTKWKPGGKAQAAKMTLGKPTLQEMTLGG